MMFRTNKIIITLFTLAFITVAGCFEYARHADAASLDSNVSEGDSEDGNNSKIAHDFGGLPMYFAKNRGQTGEKVKFYSVGSRHGLFLTNEGATLRVVSESSQTAVVIDEQADGGSKSFLSDQVSLRFSGANFANPPIGEDELPGKVNYLVGNDSSKWRTDLETYSKVRYKSVYKGIDAVFYGNQRELEYDFIVSPRANPDRILLKFDDAEKVEILESGELLIELEHGQIIQRKPVAHQNIQGDRQIVDVSFVKKGKNGIAFRLGKYDRDKELVIDPIIIFSTYFGGASTEFATSIKTDTQGNIYLTGSTFSANFPTVNPLQPTIASTSFSDAFVTKLNPAGNSVIYSTYLGGGFDDFANSVSVDAAGNAIVAGRTSSSNFPTVNALQSQLAGGFDGFVAKLNPQGSALLFSTYFGGSGFEDIASSTIDASGQPIIAGRTESGNFPIAGAIQPSISGFSFFRSQNTGGTWSSGSIDSSVFLVNSYAINPTSANVVYAATGSGVFRSDDGGSVWAIAGSLLTSSVTDVAVARSNSNIVYAVSNGAPYKSSNGGGIWSSIPNGLSGFFTGVAVDPNDADLAYLVGIGGAVFKTTNGGTSWTNVSIVGVSSQVLSIAIDPVNTQIVYVGTSQRVYKSTVGGSSWVALNNGFQFTTSIFDLLIDSATNNIYAGTQNGIYKSVDAGANWTQFNVTNLNSVRALAQDPNSFANFFSVTSTGLFFRSVDGGMTWTQSSGGLTGNSLLAVAGTSNSVVAGGIRGTDAFVSRLSSAGNALSYSTYYGGNLNDGANGVRIGSDNRITFAGFTSSSNFPVTNATQNVHGGFNDGFAARLNAGGATAAFSTYLGGASNDSATSLAIDGQGDVYIAGTTLSADYPVLNAFQPVCASCPSFNNDAFITKLNSNGSIVYSSFLGGSSNESGTAIDVDSSRQAVITGATSSNNFPVFDPIQPTTAGGNDGFVTQIKADGSGFLYSTYYGGSGNDTVTSVSIAPEGNAVILGQTTSFNFPVLTPIQGTIGGGQDAFIAKLGSAADLEILKSDERDPVMVNNRLVYNLRVKNNGPSSATAVTVTDAIPAGVDFFSVTSSHGSCLPNGATLTCNLGNLALNVQADIRIVLTPTQIGVLNSTATVSSTIPDPISGNNSDSEQTTISSLPSIAGRVASQNSQPASAVEMLVSGFQTRNVQTDAEGRYFVSELPFGGNYTVRPSKLGFYFAPRSKVYNSLTQDETADFTIHPCVYSLSEIAASFSAAGGLKNIFITTNDPFCAWNAVSNVPWISITNGSSGIGNGTVKITVQPSSAPRVGTLTIAGQTYTVSQEGCSFTLLPFQQSFGQNGGAGSFQVKTNQSFCQWTAAASDPWITFPGTSTGTGNGTLNYNISSATAPRAGRITVGGQIFNVWQEFNYCATPAFAPVVEQTVNSESIDIITADFNGDTFPDLATVDATSQQSGTFSVYIGNGNGTFNRTIRPTAIGTLSTLVSGDFNRDNKPDIAVFGAGQIAIYNGDGLGGFTLFSTFNSATGNNSKARAEDFNRDGKIDLIVAVTNQLYVLNGNGDGTFAPGFTRAVSGRFSYSYAFGDLNGDGATDVVFGQEQDFNIPRLYYFFGTTSGTFTEGGTVPLVDVTPFYLVVADLNGDGKADVLTNGYLSWQLRAFLWNSSTNAFKPATRIFTEPYAGYIFNVADVDSDGKPDIVSASNQYNVPINIMRGNGNGTFRLPVTSSSANQVNSLTFADFNRDGRIDIGFAKKFNQMGSHLNVCNPAFFERTSATRFDFDGNAKADFGVRRPSDNTWHVLNNGDQSNSTITFGAANDIAAVADYDGDGRTDFAVFRPSDGVWYQINSSDGAISIVPWGKDGDIPLPADFDGDDRADLAVFRPSENVWYWISSVNGGSFATKFGLKGDIPAPADYDGDGRSDIAVYRPADGSWYILASSDGAMRTIRFGLERDKVVPGDYDGDGKTDVALYRESDNNWYVLKSGQSGFTTIKFGTAGDIPSPADYDGDGKTDIAIFRNGVWWVLKSSTSSASTFSFGKAADLPIPSIYVR